MILIHYGNRKVENKKRNYARNSFSMRSRMGLNQRPPD